jgi:hypothetical protein
MKLHGMNTTLNTVDFVARHDLMSGHGIILTFFYGNTALAVLVCIAVAFAFRQRRLRDFPMVGHYEDLYRALMQGTKMVSNPNY